MNVAFYELMPLTALPSVFTPWQMGWISMVCHVRTRHQGFDPGAHRASAVSAVRDDEIAKGYFFFSDARRSAAFTVRQKQRRLMDAPHSALADTADPA